jgi:hypothetical protein
MPRKAYAPEASSSSLAANTLSAVPTRNPIEAYLDEYEKGSDSSKNSNDNEYRDNDYDIEDDDMIDDDRPPRPPTKGNYYSRHSRQRSPRPRTHSPPPKPSKKTQGYLIIYYVECKGGGSHKKHERTAAYLDHPRMFKGDSKLSALRGTTIIPDVSKYIKSLGRQNFIVNKIFDCEDYHEPIQSLFQPLPMPKDPEIPESIQPYFFQLRRNGQGAKQNIETIRIVSEQLRDAIVSVTGMSYRQVKRFDTSRSVDMLSHLLYQYRRLRENHTASITSEQRVLLDHLLDYMKWSNGRDYEEADELFAQGLITERHLAKLCGPNEIMVTTVDGQARAYLVDQISIEKQSSVHLELWSWEFEGAFYKEETTAQLIWPESASTEKPIAISVLSMFPLRFAPPEMEKKLRARGEMFWQCRKACFIAYNPPHAALEMRTVSCDEC